MARKVSENHVVSEQETGNAAEELIKQQNAGEEFVMGEEELEKASKPKETEKAAAADTVQELVSDQVALSNAPEDAEKVGVETEKKSFSSTVVLTGASTYLDSGTRYVKNVPMMITDRRAYEHLIKTGLFVRL